MKKSEHSQNTIMNRAGTTQINDNNTDYFTETNFDLLAQNFPHSYVVIIGNDFRIKYLSGQETSNQNIDTDTYIGQSITTLIDSISPELQKKIIQAFDGNASQSTGLLRKAMCQIKIKPLKRDQQVNNVMLIAEDISERSRVEQALEKRVLALTKPIDDVLYVSFEDLFNLQDIQKLQDQFTEATGVASVITKPDGTPITVPSNFCYLCNEIIRKSPLGRKNCYLSDAIIGRQNLSGPIIQPCLSGGLWDAGASITVGGRHIANWLIGQVRNEEQNEVKMRAYARQIQVGEEDFIEAFRKVPEMSNEQFHKVAHFLYILAQQISTLAYQNIQQARFIAERKQIEISLLDSEERYKSYVNNAPYGVIIADRTGRAIGTNPMFSLLTGYTQEELQQMSIKSIFVPEDLDILQISIHDIHTTGEGSFEGRIKQKNGNIRWWIANGVRLQDQNYLVFVTDITDKKNAAEELHKKTEELEQFFESNLDLLCIADTQGYFRRLNPEWEMSLGYSPDELHGKKFFDFVHPDDLKGTFEAVSTLSKQQPVLNFTNRYKHKNGNYRWIQWRSFPAGELIYASARDITQMVEAEIAIKDSLEKFHAVFNSMVEGCALHEVILDSRGKPVNYRLLEVNPAYSNILNIDGNIIRGKLATEVYGTNTPPYLDEFSRVGISGIPSRMTTYFEPLDMHFEISISSPKKNHFVTIFSNITERVKADEEIKKLTLTLEHKVKERTAELEISNRELEAFAYSVSHDLRAPLRSIDGYSQILLSDFKDKLDNDGQHYLDQVRKSTQQMGGLIDDLLRLSRIMRVELSIDTINLSQIAFHILENLKTQNPERNVKISIQPDIVMKGDYKLIQIAMENLLRNAWKFSARKDPAIIEVGMRTVDNHMEYYVQDNGAGFDMAYVNKLFGAFQRLHSTDEFEGTGIGLAIVQRIIQRHGGSIMAHGEVNVGATFTFTLP